MDKTFRKLMVVFCLIASLFAFAAVSVEGEVSSETVAESVLDLEISEAIANCRRERVRNKQKSVFLRLRKQGVASSRQVKRSFELRPSTERDGFNGTGAYLRI